MSLITTLLSHRGAVYLNRRLLLETQYTLLHAHHASAILMTRGGREGAAEFK